ncbi:MAG: hypothetical protein M3Y22_13665 [Pseudomonadota bacterium]|nr:hypothetical protein [Pseudomonadota bacterium]
MIFLIQSLRNNAFDTKRPFQPFQCLDPQLMVVTFHGNGWTGCHLRFAPDTQDAGMSQIDAPLAVKPIKTFNHIVRIARPTYNPFIGGIPRTLAPGDQHRHRPKPSLLRAGKRLDLDTVPDRDAIPNGGLAGGNWHFRSSRFGFKAADYPMSSTIGCIQLQVNMVDFPISFGSNS